MKLDIIEVTDNSDGTCNLKIDMDEETQNALVQYAIKHILLEAVQKTMKENEPR
jgi:hypothetical protein